MDENRTINAHEIRNGEVHDWYRIALGFSDHLVSKLLDRFKISANAWVLDPFCGSGTTLVECKKRGINSIGIEANPSSHFASIVKTTWSLNSDTLEQTLPLLREKYNEQMQKDSLLDSDPTYLYLQQSGMIERGWISTKPLKKTIAIKKAISQLDVGHQYQDLLMLALLDVVVKDASNVKFGPQLYCSKRKIDASVFAPFAHKVEAMVQDLEIVKGLPKAKAKVYQGDSRDCHEILAGAGSIAAVICSPPYPGEHDYTRHARLELAFLEQVNDRDSVQKIKRRMLRSSTKNIYKGDSDSKLVEDNRRIQSIVGRIEKKVKPKTHGFARLYPTVVLEYFGGMKRHLKNLSGLLDPGCKCAYIVGDQSSYVQIRIPTAKILGELAEETGYRVLEIERWRTSWATSTSKKVPENILILEKI
jgi:DNA methylase